MSFLSRSGLRLPTASTVRRWWLPSASTNLKVVGIGVFSDEVLPDELYPRQRVVVSPDVAARYFCLAVQPPPDDPRTLDELIPIFYPPTCSVDPRFFSLAIRGRRRRGQPGIDGSARTIRCRELAVASGVARDRRKVLGDSDGDVRGDEQGSAIARARCHCAAAPGTDRADRDPPSGGDLGPSIGPRHGHRLAVLARDGGDAPSTNCCGRDTHLVDRRWLGWAVRLSPDGWRPDWAPLRASARWCPSVASAFRSL